MSFSIPIYYGCRNISNYFPQGSFFQINIHDFNVFETIINLVESDYYEKNFDKLLLARNIILEKQNFFAFIDSQIKKDFH